VDIFEKSSVLNKSLEGLQMHLLIQKEIVKAFSKKVELWKLDLQIKYTYVDTFKFMRPRKHRSKKKSIFGTLEWFVALIFELFW
jgi:hypothetical protein